MALFRADEPGFRGWLRKRPSWKEYIQLLGLIIGFEIVWVIVQSTIANYFQLPMPTMQPDLEKFFEDLIKGPVSKSVGIFLLVGVVEEAMFRLIPLFLAMFMFGWWRRTEPLIIAILILSSIAFALVHLPNFDLKAMKPASLIGITLMVMLNQGLSGFLWGTFFLKYCGLTHFKYSWGAFWTLALMHGFWDSGLILAEKVSRSMP